MPIDLESETSLEARAEVRAWLREAWDPDVTVREWWARLTDSGWGFPHWPKAWCGKGMTAFDATAVRSEMAAAGVLGPPGGGGPTMGANVLFAHGTEEQKQRWLPAFARGEEGWCQFFSEPGAGSDLASVQCRAVRDGDEWIINGQKIWNSGTLTSERGLLVCRTDPDVPKHRGITFFIIEVDQPGIEIRPIRQMNGLSEFNEAFFTDARVADGDRIGAVGDGFQVAMTTLVAERSNFAGGGERQLISVEAGSKAGNLDRSAKEVLAEHHVRTDSVFDLEMGGAHALPVGTTEALIAEARYFHRSDDPLIRQRIAGIYAASEALRFTELRARAALASGRQAGAESSIGYLGGVRIVRLCRDLCADIAGAAGMLAPPDAPLDGAVTLSVTTAPCHGIQGGSEHIQRNIIGERILGLPKEPQVDRDIPFRQVKVGTQRT